MSRRLNHLLGRPGVWGTTAVVAAYSATTLHRRDDDDAPYNTTTIALSYEDRVRNALHHLDPHLAARGQSDAPGVVGRRHKPGQTHVVRIALTGGPCAGKSSSLDHLTRAATSEGFDVITAPEAATIMLNSGLRFDDSNDTRLLTFQTALMAAQLQLERSLTAVAGSTGRPTIIVFDRGLMDAKGYMDEALWSAVLEAHNISEHYVLRRYDGVIHLVTAANGAADHYKHGVVRDDAGKVVHRHETPEQAILLDNKMQEAWAPHARHVIIDNTGSFADKLQRATNAVLAIAHESHPQEWSRAHHQHVKSSSDFASAASDSSSSSRSSNRPLGRAAVLPVVATTAAASAASSDQTPGVVAAKEDSSTAPPPPRWRRFFSFFL